MTRHRSTTTPENAFTVPPAQRGLFLRFDTDEPFCIGLALHVGIDHRPWNARLTSPRVTGLPRDPEMESIRSRLLKVLRLAQQGVGGERENAETLLAKLLRRHSMTMADLEGALDQPRTCIWLPARDEDERTVLSQVVVRLFGTGRKLWRRATEMELGVDVTPSEHAAVIIAWEVYRAAFAEARHALVMGFCYKHGLYAAEGAGTMEMSAEDRARAARALAFAEALPVVDSPARRLGLRTD